MVDECGLLDRMMSDLERDSINDYIFQNLVLLLQSIQKDKDSVLELVLGYSDRLFSLFNTVKQVDKRITLIKTVI